MTFDSAKNFVVPFGKHKGKTIDAVASGDEGLKYLDWLYGDGVTHAAFAKALDVYLSDPGIKQELKKLFD